MENFIKKGILKKQDKMDWYKTWKGRLVEVGVLEEGCSEAKSRENENWFLEGVE